MVNVIFRAVWALLLLVALVPGRAMAQSGPDPAPGLLGVWRGPLSIPGGSLPIQLTIGAVAPVPLSGPANAAGGAKPPGAPKLVATLDLPAKRLNHVPAAVAVRADTLVVYAAATDTRFVGVLSAQGDELRGVWSQPGLRVPLNLRRAVAGAGAAPALKTLTPVVSTSYHTEAVALTSPLGNATLAGTLSIPDGPGPFPAAVLLSDMGAQDRDARQGDYRFFAGLATALARQGIAVLRLDDRGVGQSGGNGSLVTTADLVRDAQAALGYLRVRPSIDPARTGLIGHGEGGNVALLAAAQPVPPSFVVALAAAGVVGLDLLAAQPEPVTNPADTARAGAARRRAWAEVLTKAAALRTGGSNAAQVETYVAQQRLKIKNEDRKQAEALLKFRRTMLEIIRQNASDEQVQAIVVNMLRQRTPDLDPALAHRRAAQLTTPWYRNYLRFDPQPALVAVRCPTLLLNGTDDAEVNAATNLSALEKGLKANKRVSVRRLPGLNHWFQIPASELIAAPDGTVDAVISPALLDAVRDWVLVEAQ